jgi:methionyl-tRNA formyltransferase
MVADGALRVAYFGTPEFAVPTLEALIESRHTVVAVVSQPDRPRGRGQQVAHTPTRRVADAHGIPLLQPTRLKDEGFLEALRQYAPDIGVVAAYGRILPDGLLELPRLGMINVHASLLPAYRGAAPIHRAVMAGDEETGVTIMRVVSELDAGAMLDVARVQIGADETSPDVERKLAALGAARLLAVLDQLAEGRAVETAQDHQAATYAPKITREEGRVDWSRPARELHNRVRGLQPWPLVSAVIAGHRCLLHATHPEPSAAVPGAAAPGTVLSADGTGILVATGQGALRILALQPEGKRVMSAREFLAGRRVEPGALATPP